MKGGLAAAVEALYVLRDTGAVGRRNSLGRARSTRGSLGTRPATQRAYLCRRSRRCRVDSRTAFGRVTACRARIRDMEGHIATLGRAGTRGDAPGRRAERDSRRRRADRRTGRIITIGLPSGVIRSRESKPYSSARYIAARSTTSIRRNAGWKGRGVGCRTLMRSGSNRNFASWSPAWRACPVSQRKSSGGPCAAPSCWTKMSAGKKLSTRIHGAARRAARVRR